MGNKIVTPRRKSARALHSTHTLFRSSLAPSTGAPEELTYEPQASGEGRRAQPTRRPPQAQRRKVKVQGGVNTRNEGTAANHKTSDQNVPHAQLHCRYTLSLLFGLATERRRLAEPTPKELCLHNTFGVGRFRIFLVSEPGSAI